MPAIDHDGLRIAYETAGDPDGTPIVLLHGLLFTGRMFDRLADHLPHHHVITVDLRGHGRSSRPSEAWRYTWSTMAADVVAVLDHLGIDRAVVGGLSLGANVALAFALDHPTRTAGLVVEMPVLERSELAARTAFGLLAVALRLANPVLAPFGRLVGQVTWPAEPPELRAAGELLAVQPVPAAALMEGLLASPIPGTGLLDDGLAAIEAPALVIGHHLDPIHALDDAQVVVDALADARLLEVSTIVELRLRPAKEAAAIDRFLADHAL